MAPFPGVLEFTESLGLLAVASGVFLAAFLVYKLAWVLATMLITGLYISPEEQDTLVQFARRGLIGKFIAFVVLIANTGLKLASVCAQTSIMLLYSFLPLIILSASLAYFQQQWGDSASMVTSIMNDPGSPIAQTIQIILKVPLEVLSLLAHYTLPIWNLFFYIIFNLPLEIMVKFFLGDGGKEIITGLSCFAQSFPLFASAIGSYIQSNHASCPIPTPTCWNTTSNSVAGSSGPGIIVCHPVDSLSVAILCLDSTSRQLDMMPGFDKLREACSHFLRGIAYGCDSLQTFINVFLFPVTDPQLWQGLNSFLNAGIYVLVGAPTTTTARCALAGGFSTRPSMCTPDFSPAFDFAASGLQSLGNVLDNFLDMCYLLIFYGPDTPCPTGSLTNRVSIDWTLDPIALSMFASNSTVLVSLSTILSGSSTAQVWALTDGQNAMYIKQASDVKRTYFPNIWGLNPVNPRYGIAALEDGVSMLGCSCRDSPSVGLLVQCSIVNQVTVTTFNVSWEWASSPQLLKCSSVRILVQSIRWPEHRVLFSEQLSSVPAGSSSSTSLLAADAAVYVIPSCGGVASSLMACMDPAIFTLSNCFPYCMGLHLTSSTQPQQPGIVLRGYDSWASGVLVTSRDCVPVSGSSPGSSAASVSSSCSSDATSQDPQLASTSTSSTSAQQMQCSYSAICTSWVTNKSTYATTAASLSYSASIPVFADTQRYVSLVLDGQPLVAAGGVVMRMAKEQQPGAQHFIDFPMLIGNQYNEFTLEVASPVGIPVSPVPTVLSSSVVTEGDITVPPNDIEMVDLYNPAALAPDSMWYAVNPSYDWLYAFAKYCASQGSEVEVQLSFQSSYQAIRGWKVFYKNSACFIRANDGKHLCRSDVATSFDLDPTMNIPPGGITGSLLNSCIQRKEYNLFVESVEYYDEMNMVFAVRRGTIQALYNLMSKLRRSGELGHMVYYFVNTQNVTEVREAEPWTASSFPQVVAGQGVLCPALRFLPSLGTLFAQSSMSLVYGLRLIVNFIANPFALNELLASRAMGACPAEPLHHQALMDCGMNLFSLRDFFNSVYGANDAFWSIITWVASFVRPDASAPVSYQGYLESFLTGMATYGDAAHIVSLYEVVDMVSIFDTGIQDSILGPEGRRRRLLSQPLNNNDNRSQENRRRKLLGFSNVGRRVGKSLFSSLFHVFRGSTQKTFSMSHSLVDAMALKSTSVDFSVLVANDNPTYMLGSVIIVPGIVWAQFTYETLVPICLDIIANLMYTPQASSSISISAMVWVNLQESKDRFETQIETRLRQACSGLQMMLGYRGGLPEAVYYNCLSAADMHSALFQLFLIMTVEMPLYSCMCVQSAGQAFPDFILANCMQWVPASRKGLWQRLVYQSGDNMESLCQWYGGYVHDEAQHVFDSWTQDSEQAATALGSFLQDLILPNAQALGTCTAVETNPSVFTLLPIPSDHYQICGKTSVCQLRCSDALSLFYYEMNQTENPPQAYSYDVSAESPFFNPYQSTSSSLYYVDQEVVALSTRNLSSSRACSTCSAGCITMVKTPWTTAGSSMSFKAMTYCVPPADMLKATVYATGIDDWSFDVELPLSGMTLTYCDLALQAEELYVILAFSSVSLSISQSAMFSSSTGTTTNLQQLYAVWYDAKNTLHQPQQSISRLLLDTSQISALLLTQTVQKAVFVSTSDGSPIPVANSQVTQCTISNFVELASGVRGQLLFFLSLTFSAEGYTKNSNAEKVTRNGYVHAIFTWSQNNNNKNDIQFFMPCPCTSPPPCLKPSSTPIGCRAGLDAVMYLGQRGSFLYVESDIYLHISSDESTTLQYVRVDPIGKSLEFLVSAPPSLRYSAQISQGKMTLYRPVGPSVMQGQRAQSVVGVGSWSRADVFSLSGASSRSIRSPVIENISAAPIRWIQSIQSTSLSVQWFAEMRVVLTRMGFQLKSFQSQEVTTSAILETKCTPYACSGCVSSRVRLACHAVQDCMISRCIGTMVNSENVLCSIGILVQELYMQMVTSWRAIYTILVEIVMYMLNAFGGSLPQNIQLVFPTDQFYSLVCACKDVYGGMVGVGIAMMEAIAQLVNSGRIDLTMQTSLLTPQQTMVSVQVRSLGSLIFNLVSDSTLYPILALHRWLICVVNGGLQNSPDNVVTVRFGDVSLDSSWGVCSPLANDFSIILDPSQMQEAVQTSVDSFVSYTMALLSGIGDTVLYALLLMYDSMIALLLGIVWGVQNIMYAFNLALCKLSDYTQKLVLQCACGDRPFTIPRPQRAATWNQGGALWCSGSMVTTLLDGSKGIIFNPYSLDQLSSGLVGVTAYIQCLATSTTNVLCSKPSAEISLPVLTRQNVDPIAVWAQCKSNYLLQAWDLGAGALFSDSISSSGISADVYARRREAQIWASRVSPAFLDCLSAPERFNLDYGVCLNMYLNLTTGMMKNAYFQYSPQQQATEPPDACMVFSGLENSSGTGSPLQTAMKNCLMDSEGADPSACPFNPSIWSATQPSKVPVAKLFGTINNNPVVGADSQKYRVLSEQIQAAFDTLNATFAQSARSLQIKLFSADGDFIHDFFDCVFLGPYTRVDMLPCDWDGKLECPFYARDEMGGVTRQFTPCYGSVMHGDNELPFTCGSQARRAIIKYFFRDYCFREQSLDSEVYSLLNERIIELRKNFTNPASYGCLNQSSGKCSLAACNKENAYTPCLDMEFTVSSQSVSQFLLKSILQNMDSYYSFVMQDTEPWTKYYNQSGPSVSQPAQWNADLSSTSSALKESIFKPLDPVLQYAPHEVYSMPSSGSPPTERAAGSVSSLCMGLLGQGMLTLPVTDFGSGFRPLGTDIPFLGSFDLHNVEEVASLVRNITKQAASQSPFLWHKARRHAPSASGVCKQSTQQTYGYNQKIHIGPVVFEAQGQEYEVRPDEGLSFPFHGFSWGMLGYPTCICGTPIANGCMLFEEVCTGITAQCLWSICNQSSGVYAWSEMQKVWDCLQQEPKRCAELGPSDSWGLFPVDCTTEECQSAQQWVGNAFQDSEFEGIRFVIEGRSGLKLSNYKFVNNTFHEQINYASQERPASEYAIQQCFDASDLTKTMVEDEAFDTSVNDWINGLLPAVQLMFDSPVVSHCSRFIVETARAQALSLLGPAVMKATLDAEQQASLWKSKCHAKIRHLASCSALGLYYDVQPNRTLWRGMMGRHCDINLHPEWRDEVAYITPWCIAVDRIQRKMFDARLCLRALMSPAERRMAAQGISSLHKLNSSDLVSACQLQIQPLDLLSLPSPVSTVYTTGAQRLNSLQLTELSTSWDLTAVGGLSTLQASDHVSHVFDWWPVDELQPPVGFHVTAPMLAKDLAPVGYDSHYAFDPEQNLVYYVHSGLRNFSLVSNHLGAGGLCRAHSIGMPLWDANTNRVCTRTPLKQDAPHLPIEVAFQGLPSMMGPYSDALLSKAYGPQKCAPTSDDVPWQKTSPIQTAGTIPGIETYLVLDPSGTAHYVYSSFPNDVPMLSLKNLYTEWGPTCQDVAWGVSPPCMDNLTSSQCPKNSACLRLQPSSPEGICFSLEAFNKDRTRPPCFTTEHCADGLVCLADGGCSPLYLHMRNDDANGISALEFGVLANECGFDKDYHPYTQSMRGASPWEQVPDLLDMHGMCSHRAWFAYRNALQNDVCPLALDDSELMECNTTTAVWPDIQMHFGGCRTSATQRPSMEDLGSLQTIAHPCDVDFLHMNVDGKRMEVCSGYQGERTNPDHPGAYFTYSLGDPSPDMVPLPSANATYWMRTYEESSGIVHMGNLLTGPMHNTTLGFIGGEINASNPVLAAMGSGSMNFFRCADRISCQMPEFTYGGSTVDPRLDLNTLSNLSEYSLRMCGSIGAWLPAYSLCKLDHELFPLFTYLYFNSNSNNGRGCFAIWPVQDYLFTPKLVLPLPSNWQSLSSFHPNLNPQSLFCTAQPILSMESFLCVYAGRASSVLSSANLNDGVSTITQNLNRLFLDTTSILLSMVSSGMHGLRSTYEDINLCSSNLWSFTLVLQMSLQSLYASPVTSGFYIGYKLSLYEFPQQWFHQCMLNIVLSTLDSTVSAPDTSAMLSGALQIDLWSAQSLAEICDPQRLASKSGLHHIICSRSHPAYSLSDTTLQDPLKILNTVFSAVTGIANAELYENQNNVPLQCYQDAIWNSLVDGTTAAALKSFYSNNNNGACQSEAATWLCDPSTTYFHYENLASISLQDLGGNGDFARFLISSTASILDQAPALSNLWDYLSHIPNSTLLPSLPIAQVWPIDTSKFSNYVDMSLLTDNICTNSIPQPVCAPSQSVMTPSDPCFYSESEQYLDADRYLVKETPMMWIRFHDRILNISLCPHPSSSSQFVYQTDYQYLDVEQGGFLQPAILEVLAPPGVYLRAFAGQFSAEEWTHQVPAGAINCAWSNTWSDNELDSWWPGASGAGSSSMFDNVSVNFQDMATQWWQGNADWKNIGCGGFGGVMVIEYRFDDAQPPGSIMSECTLSSVEFPISYGLFNAHKPSACPYDASGNQLRAFRIRDGFSRNSYGLWRCLPCTKYKTALVSSSGMFNCSLTGNVPLSNMFTEDMLLKTFPMLYNPDTLSSLLKLPVAMHVFLNQSSVLFVLSDSVSMGDLSQLSYWGGATALTDPACFDPNKMWDCLAYNDGLGYDTTYTLEQDQLIWDRAVNNPSIPLTMTCLGQQYTYRSQEYCNTNTDQRRQALSQFVERQYRKTDGVWLQQVQSGWATAFEANVAHSAVSKFTLFYTSGDRKPKDVKSAWVLGNGPCSTDATVIENRICVQSLLSGSHFEPLHPWVGGDFNPFMGLDECPILQPASICANNPYTRGTSRPQQGISMCACTCSPTWACGGSQFNYSAEFMLQEFPQREACQKVSYSQTLVMDVSDESNICQQTDPSQDQGCSINQGLLGGYVGSSVSTTVLHATEGTGVLLQGTGGQTLVDYSSDFTQSLGITLNNPLWLGGLDKGSLLSMPRNHIHPAHIAFGLDATMGSMPLKTQQIALLPRPASWSNLPSSSWAQNLKEEWLSELGTISKLYPQLAKRQSQNAQDWSCPIRSLVFWGSSTPSFGPVTPNPVVASLLYNLSGVHPFIKPQGPYAYRADYYTTNGICYYRYDASASWIQIPLSDIESPCSLRGMLSVLETETEAPVSVQENFATRCNDIIDTPDAGGPLRSGETLEPAADQVKECGLLNRLTPALISTRADTASVARSPTLNTSSEGGDCHMGRLAWVSEDLQGRHCFTVSKNASAVTVYCPYTGHNKTYARGFPLTLEELVSQNAVVYFSEFVPSYPKFYGPSKGKLHDSEISFGQLYAATLKETLSNDLRQYVNMLSWTSQGFFKAYLNGSLGRASTETQKAQEDLILQQKAQTQKVQRDAQAKDNTLWNNSDWVWSFLNHSSPKGNVSRLQWSQNRTRACNKSMEAFLAHTPNIDDSIRRISLCSPAATGDLGILCTAMTQFAVDVAQTNCQLAGNGNCISNLGMFYLPYQWSNTNQDYSFNTVSNYYKTLIQSYFLNESYDSYCTSGSSILQTLAKLSEQQNAICPASGLDLFKSMLSDLRTAGHDLLFLAYNFAMMIANLVAAMFTLVRGGSGVYLDAAGQYMVQMLVLVKEFLVMVLDIFTELLMYVSSLGQIFSNIIIILCKVYNWLLDNLISQIWCGAVRPIVIGLLKAVQILAFMSGGVVSSIQILLDKIGDGDVTSCIAYFETNGQAKCPSTDSTPYNASQFQTQALASLCWSQAQGGGVFTGASDSLLSCTSSDTCALDPLLFDDPTRQGLVYCGSCPSVDTSVDGFQFGCDVYLQRCVCGTRTQQQTVCLTNADCLETRAMCSIASRVDNLRSSMLSSPCSSCGSMSMQSICIVDGQGSAGICGCANVLPNMLTCSAPGSSAPIGSFSTQLCPVILDASLEQMLMGSSQPQTIGIDFSEVAITHCNLGNYRKLCLNLQVPLPLTTGGNVEQSYVVLLGLVSVLQPGRRLLFSQTDRLVSYTRYNNKDEPVLFIDWVERNYPKTSETCKKPKHEGRTALKNCMFWALLGGFTVDRFNLSKTEFGDGFSMFSPTSGVVMSLYTLAPYLWEDQELRHFVLSHLPYGKSLMETGGAIQRLTNTLFQARPLHQRKVLQLSSNASSTPSQKEDRGDWILNCSSVSVPIGKISNAVWDTINYYQDAKGNTSGQDVECDISKGLANCLGYSLPPLAESAPSTTASTKDLVIQYLLYIPTLGMGQERVMNAILSPIPYEESEQYDYLTGQRILQDFGTCNFTRLTFGPSKQRNFLAMFCFLVFMFSMISFMCLPFSLCSWILWSILFPIVLFWSLYNISPLCWPMIPPRFVADLHEQVSNLFPTTLAVPRYLVKPHCTVDGKLSDGTYDPRCFSSCSDPPFLFVSWQDSFIWWICEASTSTCMHIGNQSSSISFFQDLASSATYYADVINYAYKDPELVQAHRLCAFLTMYNVVFLGLAVGISCYLIPSVLMSINEIFCGCVLLVFESYNVPEG